MGNGSRANPSQLNIYLLGQPKIMMDDRPILTELTTKSLVLVLYLAANWEKSYSREVLSEMLWPELPMENSKSNLRQILSSIKKSWCAEVDMEDSIISADKGSCSLNCNIQVFVDLPIFYKGIKSGLETKDRELLKKSIDLYRGNFLEGFYVKGSAAVDEWILFERESVSRYLRESSKALASLYEQEGQVEKALYCLNQLIKTDVLQEDVYRDLMALHYKIGNRNQAIALYNQCTKVLRKELNISPMEETKQLYKEIMGDGRNCNKVSDTVTGAQRENGILRFGNHALAHRNVCKDFSQKLTESGQCRQEVALKSNPFGGIEYEGFYSLIEELLKSNVITSAETSGSVKKFFPELFGEIRNKPGEEGNDLSLAEMLYSFRILLEKAAEKVEGLLITVVDYETLDGQTKQLIRYLLGNAKAKNLYLLIGYREKEKIQDLERGFKDMV